MLECTLVVGISKVSKNHFAYTSHRETTRKKFNNVTLIIDIFHGSQGILQSFPTSSCNCSKKATFPLKFYHFQISLISTEIFHQIFRGKGT